MLGADIQSDLENLVFPLEIQIQTAVPSVALALLQRHRKVKQGPVWAEYLHPVAIPVRRLKGTTVGPHHKIPHSDLARRGTSIEDMPDKQEFRILGNQLGPHPGDAEVVEPAVYFGIRSRSRLLAPRAPVFEIVHLTHQILGQEREQQCETK